MIVQRLIGPGSKLSATRRFSKTTLADELALGEVEEAELLGAMDWLLERQERIERTLAKRHLEGEGFVLYDLSSSYVEGRCCPLATLGYSRDGGKGKPQVNYGLICCARGPPGRGLRARRLDSGPADLAGRSRGGPRALRDLGRGRGRRSRHDHQGPRQRAQRRGGGLRQRAEDRPDPLADRLRRSAAVAL